MKAKYRVLRRFSGKHNHINSNNWADYLYYFYQGSSQVIKGEATPRLNPHTRKIILLRDSLMLLDKCD
jgi:hypothetical protein